MSVHTLCWPGGWARIAPWRQHAEIAHLTVGADAPPSLSTIERCVVEFRRLPVGLCVLGRTL